MIRAALALVGLLGGGACLASGWELETGVGHDRLGGGRQDWQQLDLALRGTRADQVRLELEARRIRRYGQADHEVGAALQLAPAPGWSARLGATLSPDAVVLPRWSARGELRRELEGGWLLGGDLRLAGYDEARSHALALVAERYVSDDGGREWRLAGRLGAVRLDIGGHGVGAALSLDRYFAGGGRLGVVVAHGDEPESLGQGAVAVTRLHTLALLARWPLAAGWRLVGHVESARVEGGYRRVGGRLGVQRDL